MEALLIKKVRENDVLYNSQSTHYRDMDVRQKTWEKIGKELNLKADEVKFTWDKLRRCFINARNRRRIKEAECGITIHPWKYEKAMSFLWPFVIRNRKTRELCKPDYQASYENGESDQDDCGADHKLECNHPAEGGDNIKTESEDVQEFNSPAPSVTFFEHDDIITPIETELGNSADMKREYPYDDDGSERIDGKRNCPMQENSILEMDECDLFFMSMSKMTKSLPILERAKVKLVVSNSVLQALIAVHGNTNPPN